MIVPIIRLRMVKIQNADSNLQLKLYILTHISTILIFIFKDFILKVG